VASFDDRLKQEIQRRDAALQRMKTASTATKTKLEQEMKEMKTDYSPSGMIQQNPWPTVLGAVAAGAIIGSLVKNAFFPAPRYAYKPPPPQKVVVEVAGVNGGPQQPQTQAMPWGKILDAAMHGLPAVIAYTQQFMQQQSDSPAQQERTEMEANARAEMGQKPKPPESFKASISRRTAPPPPES